jgi:hypothetical protein
MTTIDPLTIPGISLWLDASDTNNITVNNGIVTQWLDKSGNNYKVNIIGSPPFATNSVTFDGTNSSYFKLQDGCIPYRDSAFSMYFVISMADNGNRGVLSAGSTTSPNNPLQIRNTGSQSMYLNAGTVVDTYPALLNPSFNQSFIYGVVCVKDTSTSSFINGVRGAYVITGMRYQTNSPNYLGCHSPSSLPMKGSISEVLIFGTAHSAAVREQLEGYLAWKWNLNGTLNAKHPYKTVPPVVTLEGSLGGGVIYSPLSLTKSGPPLIPGQILLAGGYTTNTGLIGISYSYDGISWSRSNAPLLQNDCYRIAYNGTMYVATNGINNRANNFRNSPVPYNSAGDTSAPLYSYDGINWLQGTQSFSAISDVTWSVTKSQWMMIVKGFSPIGGRTAIWTSLDGITWTFNNTSQGISNAGYNAKWIANQWVATITQGNTFIINTSPDAINWTRLHLLYSNPFDHYVDNSTFIEYNGSIILIGFTTFTAGNSPILLYSTDNLATIPVSNSAKLIFSGGMYGVAWNGLIWVGVGAGTASIATSTDGITWTAIANSLSIFTSGSSVAWNGVRWVAGGWGTNSTAYSSDGVTWTGTNNLPYTNTLALCSTNILPYTQVGATPPITGSFPASLLPLCEVWLDASDPLGTGTQPTYNQEMTLWVDKTGNGRNAIPYKIAPTAFGAFTVASVAGTNALNNQYLYYSTDGKTNWTPCTSPFTSSLGAVAYNGTSWLAAAVNSTPYLAYSTDGITWTAVSNGLPTGTRGIAKGNIIWANSFWLICISMGSDIFNFYKSTDGLNWTLTIANKPANFIRFFKNKFYLVLQNSVSTSTDGVTWTLQSFNYNVPLPGGYAGIRDLQWDGNLWMLTHVSPGITYPIYTSTDGINWTANESANSLYSYRGPYGGGAVPICTNCNGVWLAGFSNVNNTNSIIYSKDGLTWAAIPTVQAFGNNNCENITFNGTVFIATINNAGGYVMKTISSPDGLTWTSDSSLQTLVPYTSTNPAYIQTIVTKTVLPVINIPGLIINANSLNRMPVADARIGTMRIPYKAFPVSGYTIMAVQYSNSTTSTSKLLSNYTGNLLFYGVNGASTSLAITNGTNYGTVNAPAVNTANQWLVTGYTSTSTTGIPYASGTALNSNSGTGGVSFDDIIIGTNGAGSQYWNGYVAEILIFSTVLTKTQRQLAEGYLSWKWGLVSNLPTIHPYSNSFISDIPYPIGSFSPVNINGLVAWYDGKDPLNTGKAPSNLSTVSTWYDKSGNGWNMNQNGALPTYNKSLIAGLAGLDFTSGGGLYVPSVQKSSNITLFWVGTINSTVTNNGMLFGHFSSENTDAVLRMVGTTPNVGWRTNNTNTSVPITYDSPVIFSCTMENGTNMFIQKTDMSGTITASSTQTSSIVAGQNGNIDIGSISPGIQLVNSFIGEVVYYHTLLPLPQRQLIEGYLAWRWNLNTYLPESNPYSKINPIAPPVIAPPICFLKGSIVETDQAVVEIQNIDPNVHTIGGKKIIALTKTPGDKMSLVLIRRNLIARGSPYVDTPITIAHKILYNNKLIPAIFIPGATPYKFTNQLLYNVLLESHETMRVNGMVVETLSHEHPIAKKCLDKSKE